MNKCDADKKQTTCACTNCYDSLAATGWPVAKKFCGKERRRLALDPMVEYTSCLGKYNPAALAWWEKNQGVTADPKWNTDANHVIGVFERTGGAKEMADVCQSPCALSSVFTSWPVHKEVCDGLDEKNTFTECLVCHPEVTEWWHAHQTEISNPKWGVDVNYVREVMDASNAGSILNTVCSSECAKTKYFQDWAIKDDACNLAAFALQHL